MAGLDLFGAGNGDDSEDLFPGNAGALGAISQQPDFAAAIALLSGHGGGMPTNQSQSMIDAFRQRYTGILPKADELQKARQQWEQSAYQAQDPRTKWLQFASGLLSPTHTGTFGESLGYGLKGLAEGQNRENQMAAQVAQQRFGNMMGL